MRDHLGWFAPMFKAALSSIESTVNGSGEDLKVGRRRRATGTRWQDRLETGATIYYPEDSGSGGGGRWFRGRLRGGRRRSVVGAI